MNWKLLEKYIPVGEKNAIHMQELGERLGMTTEGAKALVRMARPEAEKEGVVIASSSKGYFIPDGIDELKHYYFYMRKQAKTRMETIAFVKSLIEAEESKEGGTEG